MARVALLGAGGVFGGRAGAALAALEPGVEIVAVSRSPERARAAAEALGPRAEPAVADIRDDAALGRCLSGCDLVLNVAGPDREVVVPALRGAIRAGVAYADLNADGPATRDALALDGEARAVGVPAALNLGVLPGVTNLLALRGAQRLEEAHAVAIAWVEGPTPRPAPRAIPRASALNASMQVTFAVQCGPVAVFDGGALREVEPYTHGIDVLLDGGATVTAWAMGTPEPLTLPRTIPGLRSAVAALTRFPPAVNALHRAAADRVVRGEIALCEGVVAYLRALSEAPPDTFVPPQDLAGHEHAFGAVTVWGALGGHAATYRARFRHAPGLVELPLVLAARRILRGEGPPPGVHAPEAWLDPGPFLDELAAAVGAPFFTEELAAGGA